MKNEYHVSPIGNDQNNGSANAPFRTISKAARTAMAGDTITVHEGVYREWVSPDRGGEEGSPILYRSAPGEKAIIKGSEQIQNWIKIGKLWKAILANEMFADYNPYSEAIDGDWMIRPSDPFLHTGSVFLNGTVLSEAPSLLAAEESENSWFAEVGEDNTVIYANFGDSDPNAAEAEVSVRKCCFYPQKTGINYIIVRGFEMAQAACPWTPPTADQPGMLGTHWSKGWIIEDNILHDARCSAVSIGKEISTGHNLCTRYHRKPGYQYQMEAVFRALRIGWNKENIGSHIIRRNTIYDCGQNGIVGHMGGAFSDIYQNHIYNIGNKNEFFGYEIAGIKLHAAIDTQIHNNYIHNCARGTWLDWQAQGARVYANLYDQNELQDLMVEVTHGPYIVDNNIFASEHNVENAAQGGAWLHNLFFGTDSHYQILDRSTPYHFGHTTEVAGTALVYGGDDRVYQNVYAGLFAPNEHQKCGTGRYNGAPVSLEEYERLVLSGGRGDHENFVNFKQPVYIGGNCYFHHADFFAREKGGCFSRFDFRPQIVTEDGKVYLDINVPEELLTLPTRILDGLEFETPRITEEPYENPDGTPICFDVDFCGQPRKASPTPGPLENLCPGHQRILLWEIQDPDTSPACG